MNSHIFGWSYPPGAANDPNAPYNQTDIPCFICGQLPDDCICPECPVCGDIGNDDCYKHHGLVRTPRQVALRAAAEADWEQNNAMRNAAEEAAYEAWREEHDK